MKKTTIKKIKKEEKRYIDEETFRENTLDQIAMAPIIFEELEEQGVREGMYVPLHFYFYTDQKEKAKNLYDHLSLHREISLNNLHLHDDEWAITGIIAKCLMEIDIIQAIVKGLSSIGYGYDVAFDGWEVEVDGTE